MWGVSSIESRHWQHSPHAIHTGLIGVADQLQGWVGSGEGEHAAVQRLLWQRVVSGVILAWHDIDRYGGLKRTEIMDTYINNQNQFKRINRVEENINHMHLQCYVAMVSQQAFLFYYSFQPCETLIIRLFVLHPMLDIAYSWI